jgi:hypothetical protein
MVGVIVIDPNASDRSVEFKSPTGSPKLPECRTRLREGHSKRHENRNRTGGVDRVVRTRNGKPKLTDVPRV